ncbi:MAG: translation initiation factor IF-3, partial [bacterium]
MRISHRKRYFKRSQQPAPGAQYRANDRIRSAEVLLIDENGQSLGVLSVTRANEIAAERELDLVEVSPLANPPVAKLLDYGAFK